MYTHIRVLLFLAAVSAALPLAPAHGQALPNHVDPSARDIVPNLPAVPSLRFLTTADFPPFNFRDKDGQLIGFNIDLARAICGELKSACTVQAWPWEQAANALADNQGDALIAGVEISPDNGARFDFSALYLELPGRFVARSADVARFDPAALTGKSIAVRGGSRHEEFIRRYLPGAAPKPFPTEFEALDALKAGGVDFYFGDAMRASFWINNNLDCCAFAGDPYFRPDLFGEGLAVAVPAGHDAVRQAIDWALVRLQRDGRTDELYLRWFPVSFY